MDGPLGHHYCKRAGPYRQTHPGGFLWLLLSVLNYTPLLKSHDDVETSIVACWYMHVHINIYIYKHIHI